MSIFFLLLLNLAGANTPESRGCSYGYAHSTKGINRQMPNLATEICLRKETVDVYHYGVYGDYYTSGISDWNLATEKSLPLHPVVLGLLFTGLLFVCLLILQVHVQRPALSSEPSSATCKYFSYGAISSALALVLFLIHFFVKKFRQE